MQASHAATTPPASALHSELPRADTIAGFNDPSFDDEHEATIMLRGCRRYVGCHLWLLRHRPPPGRRRCRMLLRPADSRRCHRRTDHHVATTRARHREADTPDED